VARCCKRLMNVFKEIKARTWYSILCHKNQGIMPLLGYFKEK
jgi:hypothetical protein